MHAFYRRLLHLHHDHEAAAGPVSPVQPPAPGAKPASRTRPAPGSTPSPRLSQRAKAGRDRKPSLHALAVPRLIDSGCTLDQITDLTGMPRALVELIADEHASADVTVAAAASAKREVWRASRREAGLARRRRTRTRAVTVIVLAAVLNIAATIASVTWRIPALGAAATLGSFLLILAVFVLARHGIRTASGPSGPPQ